MREIKAQLIFVNDLSKIFIEIPSESYSAIATLIGAKFILYKTHC